MSFTTRPNVLIVVVMRGEARHRHLEHRRNRSKFIRIQRSRSRDSLFPLFPLQPKKLEEVAITFRTVRPPSRREFVSGRAVSIDANLPFFLPRYSFCPVEYCPGDTFFIVNFIAKPGHPFCGARAIPMNFHTPFLRNGNKAHGDYCVNENVRG